MDCEQLYHGEDDWCPRPATYWVLIDNGPLGTNERALCNNHAAQLMIGVEDRVHYIQKIGENEVQDGDD